MMTEIHAQPSHTLALGGSDQPAPSSSSGGRGGMDGDLERGVGKKRPIDKSSAIDRRKKEKKKALKRL